VITLSDRGGLRIPPLALATVILYTLGYFIRLAVMTKVSKTGDPASIRKYFVEEKMIALPASVAALALLSWSGLGSQASELEWGFVKVWTDPVILPLFGIGATLTVISVLSIVILLDARENAYCVPLERAASLVAGVGGALLLAWFWGLPQPREAELIGAAILIGCDRPALGRPETVAADGSGTGRDNLKRTTFWAGQPAGKEGRQWERPR
jgi:hypothetical protein